MKTRVETFAPEHQVALGGDANVAIINQQTGPAMTLMTDERKPEIIGCGGIRIDGIGQAWAQFSPAALKDMPIAIIRQSKQWLHEMMVAHKLYRLYAEASEGVDTGWFKAVHFRPDNRLFVR